MIQQAFFGRRVGQWAPIVVALLLLVLALPTRRASAGNRTFSVTLPGGSAVTMGDPSGTLSFTVTNTDTTGTTIREARFFFLAAYKPDASTTAPANWFVVAETGTNSLRFFTFGAGIADGGSLTFAAKVTGGGGALIPAAAADVTDTLANATANSAPFGGVTFTRDNPPGLPSWTRRGLDAILAALPSAVGVGSQMGLDLTITNRTNATQNAVVPAAPTVSGSGSATLLSGPTPASLSLAAGASGIVHWTYTAASAGSVTFQSAASNAAPATSSQASAGPVLIGNFTASLSVTPEQVVTGQNVTVKMVVTNNGSVSLPNVRPSALVQNGTATATLVSGPTPASIAALPVGAASTFQWVYAISGALNATYTFTGNAIGDTGSTPSATSNTGMVGAASVTVTPATVAGGSTNVTFTFVLQNRTGASLNRVRITTPNATGFIYASASGGRGDGTGSQWTVATAGTPTAVTFTAPNSGERIANGSYGTFFVTYSALPSPTANTDYQFTVEGATSSIFFFTLAGPFTLTVDKLDLAVNPTTIPSDGSTTSIITATVTSGGSPVGGATVSFSASTGTLTAGTATTNAAGQAVTQLIAPYSATAPPPAIVSATSGGAGNQTIVSFTAPPAGPNLLYVGGTLAPTSGTPGASLAITLDLRNSGGTAMALTTASYLRFSDGTNTYQANLNAATSIAAAQQKTVTFASAAVPSAIAQGNYNPSLSLTDGSIVQARPVYDPLGIRRDLPVSWTYTTPTGLPVLAAPTVLDGVAYVGADDGYLYAVNATALAGGTPGTLRWKYPSGASGVGGHVRSPVLAFFDDTPTVNQGVVYFTADNSHAYAVKLDGTLLWDSAVGASSPITLTGAILANDGSQNVVYLGSSDGNVYGLRSTDGVTIKTQALGAAVQSTPAVFNDGLWVGADNGTLSFLTLSTLMVRWSVSLGSLPVRSSPWVDGTKVYVGSQSGRFGAFNASNGTTQWVYTATAAINSSPWLDVLGSSNAIYFGSEEHRLYALDTATGAALAGWPHSPNTISQEAIPTSPVLVPSVNGGTAYLYAGGGQSLFYAVRSDAPTSGFFLLKDTATEGVAARFGSPALSGITAGEVIVVGAANGKIYGLALQ